MSIMEVNPDWRVSCFYILRKENASMSAISAFHDEPSEVVLIKVNPFPVIFTLCLPLPCISPVSCDPTDPIYLIYFRTFNIKATHSSCCGYNPSTASACFILEGVPLPPTSIWLVWYRHSLNKRLVNSAGYKPVGSFPLLLPEY